MAYPGYQNSLLLSQFREFYRELARLRALAINPANALKALPSEAGAAPAIEGKEMWQRLLSLLEMQAARASRSGGAFGFEVYREAQYVMAALADEVFLNEEWPGRGAWLLLETKLFYSCAAGEVFFKKLDVLLQQRDPVYLDLAAVYFFALSLGFQGKYRDNDPQNRLDRYRRQLFAMIFRQNPELLQADTHLFAQTYSHTLSEGKVAKLPHPRNWLLLVVAVVVLWLGVSQILWAKLSSPIKQRLCDITPQSCDQGGK
jgi:type VI secretion system protein ImpK